MHFKQTTTTHPHTPSRPSLITDCAIIYFLYIFIYFFIYFFFHLTVIVSCQWMATSVPVPVPLSLHSWWSARLMDFSRRLLSAGRPPYLFILADSCHDSTLECVQFVFPEWPENLSTNLLLDDNDMGGWHLSFAIRWLSVWCPCVRETIREFGAICWASLSKLITFRPSGDSFLI